MPKMRLALRMKMSLSTVMKMQLARSLTMPESATEDEARRIEADPLFKCLSAAGVLGVSEFSAARFAARRFAGHGLRMSGGGLPELVDGNCDLVRLMQGMGQERFKKWFLGEGACSDEDRAQACEISVVEARKLREFADRAFIQGEFEGPSPAPEKVFSTVAGIEIEGGKPVLAFFHREVWKQRYRVNKGRLAEHLAGVLKAEAGEVKDLLNRLELVEQRKTTLYRLLEEVLRVQEDYLCSGDPSRRQALTQRALAAKLGVAPSAICQLISNKSVQMPWGLEAPLAVFFPSGKDINRGRVYSLAGENQGLTDAGLARELERVHGVRLSRRSIAQYRKDLSLAGRWRRGETVDSKDSVEKSGR
jgi:hypothetical protein